MAVSRDCVNRVQNLHYFPAEGIIGVEDIAVGASVSLTEISEEEIADPYILDPMEMEEPARGNAPGDAVFDAMGKGAGRCVLDPMAETRLPDALGDATSDNNVSYVIGFEDDNLIVLLGISSVDEMASRTDN